MAKKSVKLSSFDKILGILFHPKELFSKLKKEKLEVSFKLYTSLMLVLTTAAFFLSVLFYNAIGVSLHITIPLRLIFLLLFYLVVYLFISLCVPSLVVNGYYMLLRMLFKMHIDYDQCYKSIVYSMIQIWIFTIFTLLLSSIIYQFHDITALIFAAVAITLIIIYNIVTEIHGLFILCNVKKHKAVLVILAQALFVILFLIVIKQVYWIIAPLLQNF